MEFNRTMTINTNIFGNQARVGDYVATENSTLPASADAAWWHSTRSSDHGRAWDGGIVAWLLTDGTETAAEEAQIIEHYLSRGGLQ